MSTASVAKKLGVGTTSVKRWAEKGLLVCMVTPGGHRRFDEEEVMDFVKSHSPPQASMSPSVEAWLEVFSGPTSQHAAYDAILRARSRLPSWCSLADELGEVLQAMGHLWRNGNMSIAAEHEMSELLSRVLAQCSSTIAGNPNKRCVLATAPGDNHTLGLSLLEVCIREMGFGTRWLGAKTPVEELNNICTDPSTSLIALSASRDSQDENVLQEFLLPLKEVAEKNNVSILLGGHGLWPADPATGFRVRSFGALPLVLRKIASLTS